MGEDFLKSVYAGGYGCFSLVVGGCGWFLGGGGWLLGGWGWFTVLLLTTIIYFLFIHTWYKLIAKIAKRN